MLLPLKNEETSSKRRRVISHERCCHSSIWYFHICGRGHDSICHGRSTRAHAWAVTQCCDRFCDGRICGRYIGRRWVAFLAEMGGAAFFACAGWIADLYGYRFNWQRAIRGLLGSDRGNDRPGYAGHHHCPLMELVVVAGQMVSLTRNITNRWTRAAGACFAS